MECRPDQLSKMRVDTDSRRSVGMNRGLKGLLASTRGRSFLLVLSRGADRRCDDVVVAVVVAVAVAVALAVAVAVAVAQVGWWGQATAR